MSLPPGYFPTHHSCRNGNHREKIPQDKNQGGHNQRRYLSRRRYQQAKHRFDPYLSHDQFYLPKLYLLLSEEWEIIDSITQKTGQPLETEELPTEEVTIRPTPKRQRKHKAKMMSNFENRINKVDNNIYPDDKTGEVAEEQYYYDDPESIPNEDPGPDSKDDSFTNNEDQSFLRNDLEEEKAEKINEELVDKPVLRNELFLNGKLLPKHKEERKEKYVWPQYGPKSPGEPGEDLVLLDTYLHKLSQIPASLREKYYGQIFKKIEGSWVDRPWTDTTLSVVPLPTTTTVKRDNDKREEVEAVKEVHVEKVAVTTKPVRYV